MSKVIAMVAGTFLCMSAAPGIAGPTANLQATPASFANLDKNADNRISKTEAGMDRRLSNVFAYVDTNGDGFISRTEYLAQNATAPDRS